MHRLESLVALYLMLNTVDDISASSCFLHYSLHSGLNSSEAFYVFILATSDALTQVLHILLAESRVRRQVQNKD